MSKVKKVTLATTLLASSVWLAGCGLFGGDEKSQIDPPKDVSLVEDEAALEETAGDGKAENSNDEAVEENVKLELYLIDKNGYVVPQTFELPKTEGVAVAKQALQYLVENGPVSEILPDGFRAVIPADTSLSVKIEDSVATVDFSKEFKNYNKEDEKKILEAITWTLTQFDSVETVKLQINGEELNEMPVNKTPISEGLSRTTGVNIDTSNISDITNTKPVTVYYIGGKAGEYYYVPVTRRVSEATEDNITAAINELVKGPSLSSDLLTEFVPDIALLDKPKFEDGKVTLNFNESILGSSKEKKISQNVLNALVLSLTEQPGIESVEVQVNGSADLVNEEGKPMTEPVVRPAKVNTVSF